MITGGWSASGSDPETGLEEINRDLREADFRPASLRVRPGHSGLPVIHSQFVREHIQLA